MLPLAELFELEAVENSLAVAPNIVVPIELREVKEKRSPVGEVRLGSDSVLSSLREPDGEAGTKLLV